MARKSTRYSRLRGVGLVLAGLMVGGMLIGTATAHNERGEEHKHIRKFVRQSHLYLRKNVTTHSVSEGGVNGDSDSPKEATASCPAGKIAVGGGAGLTGPFDVGSGEFLNPPIQVILQVSRPAGANSWSARAVETSATGNDWRLVAFVRCAKV